MAGTKTTKKWQEELVQLPWETLRAIAVAVANDLGIFRYLGSGAKSLDRICRAVKTDKESTAILLNALVGQGLLHKTSQGYRVPSELKPLLSKEDAESLQPVIAHFYNLVLNWLQLQRIVREGREEFSPVVDLRREEAVQRNFTHAMIASARGVAEELARKLPLKQMKSMLDLGGGPGTYSVTFCSRNRKLRSVVFDFEVPLRVAKQQIEKARLQHRVKRQIGNFLRDPIGEDYDLILLSSIIHAYDRKDNVELLKKCYKAMAKKGMIVVKDLFLNRDLTTPPHVSLFALNMLTNTAGGRTYTQKDVMGWLKTAGFKAIKKMDLSGPSSVVLAKK